MFLQYFPPSMLVCVAKEFYSSVYFISFFFFGVLGTQTQGLLELIVLYH